MPSPETITDLKVINQALGAGLGENELTDLNAATKIAATVRSNYGPVKYACMTKTSWRAFTAKATLNQLSGTPINRWQYAYQLPSDCLKVLTTWPVSNYELQNNRLYTNASSVDIDYIRNLEEAYWPRWFEAYVVASLVKRLCRGITGKDPSPSMEAEVKSSLIAAQFADAGQQPNQSMATNDFVDCRA